MKLTLPRSAGTITVCVKTDLSFFDKFMYNPSFLTSVYTKENFAETCRHSFLDDFADEIGEAKECANDYEFGIVHRQCCWDLSETG